MAKLNLTMATLDYEHVRDLACGKIRADGIDLNSLTDVNALEAPRRYADFAEFHICELPMARHLASVSRDEDRWVAIPIFPSRLFRLSTIYVRSDHSVDKPDALAGKRIGLRDPADTSTIYVKGWISDYLHIPLKDIRWLQADARLDELLLDGEIDALISADPPDAFARNDARIRRLIAEPRSSEEQYWKDTAIFPILHTVAIRRDVFDANRWVARSLYKAFLKAKDNALARLSSQGIAKFPMPWGSSYAETAQHWFGKDYWPYGVQANRTTLEAFCKFAFEQGVCARRLSAEDLFPPEVQR